MFKGHSGELILMPELHLKSLQQAFPPRRLSIPLAIVVALTPFAIDMYLPAMPAMVTYFVTGIEQIEMTMPLFLIGFAPERLGHITPKFYIFSFKTHRFWQNSQF